MGRKYELSPKSKWAYKAATHMRTSREVQLFPLLPLQKRERERLRHSFEKQSVVILAVNLLLDLGDRFFELI